MGDCPVIIASNSKAMPPETALRNGRCGVPPWDIRQKLATCCVRDQLSHYLRTPHQQQPEEMGGWEQLKELSLRCWGDPPQQVVPCSDAQQACQPI